MHFSNEVLSKSLQLKINNTEPLDCENDDNFPTNTTSLRESIICQKSFQNEINDFVGFKQMNIPLIDTRTTTTTSEKSLRYYFPSTDENHINYRLKESTSLTNIVESTLK